MDTDATPRCGNGLTAALLGRAATAPAADVGANDDSAKYAADGGAAMYAQMADARSRADRDRRPLQAERAARHPGQAAARPRDPERARRRAATSSSPSTRTRRARSRPGSARRRSSARTSAPSRRSTRRCGSSSSGTSRTSPPSGDRSSTPPGANVSAAAFGPYLAAAYDALKAVDPDLNVVGVGLSPRGNDRPHGEEQHLDLAGPLPPRARRAGTGRAGARARSWTRSASIRTRTQATDPLERGYAWPNAGFVEPRPDEAGALGRVPRHGAADDGRRPEAAPRRGRLAGRHVAAAPATGAPRTSRSPTRSRRPRSTAS